MANSDAPYGRTLVSQESLSPRISTNSACCNLIKRLRLNVLADASATRCSRRLAPAVLMKESGISNVHLAAQYVKKLWKSVNPSALQELTNSGRLPIRAQLPWSLQCRPKTQHLNWQTAIADTLSAVEHRTSALPLYRHGDYHHQRQGECQEDARH